MLTDRKLLKQITQALLRKPTWKIIVRNNSWLCPFCGMIGARHLSMEEQIEGKIAQHLTAECEAWQNFAGPEQSLDDLRRRAKLIIFKIRIGKWIISDRRYSMATDDGSWICPYCATLTDVGLPDGDPRAPGTYGDAPEESPFLTGIARHFLQCKGFEAEQLQSQQQLDEIKAKVNRQSRQTQVQDRFLKEPEWQLLDSERNWLCPFCANSTKVKFPNTGPTPQFYKGLGEHLLVCRSYRSLRGKPRPVKYLTEKVAALGRERRLEALRRKIGSHAIWRCRDSALRWYCPYCAERAGFLFPDAQKNDPVVFGKFTDEVLNHLRRCPVYKQRKASIKSKEVMFEVLQKANQTYQAHQALMIRFQSNPLFKVVSDDRSWVCPYCVAIADEVELDPDLGHMKDHDSFVPVAELVFTHLRSCPGYRGGAEPTASLADLKAEVMQRSHELGDHDDLGVTRITDEWTKLKEEIALHQSVEEGDEDALQASIESAKATRRRLLPNLPEIPGYDFAAEQISCEDIGGDFYDFFAVNEQVWGVVIGGISDHGVEATLTMSLTKKLLQSHGRRQRSCTETLVLTNQDIYEELDEDTFVSVFFGFLNVQTRAFMFSRAGHHPLLVYNPLRTPRLNIFKTNGMALGVDEGPIFSKSIEQRSVQLAAGDVLVQCSNGLITAPNDENEPFGAERIQRLIEQYGHEDAEYLAWKIRKAVQSWQGKREPDEDITLIALKLL
ncbi:MAG: PP2C family protein-serine/threonine phosphatase [Planctomycetota bacterium]|nr:PP2C family protein-serine/threonine phosphatase [Planctomycetota bacterium]